MRGALIVMWFATAAVWAGSVVLAVACLMAPNPVRGIVGGVGVVFLMVVAYCLTSHAWDLTVEMRNVWRREHG